MTTLTLTSPDISCDHCRRTIEGELGAVPGVDRVAVAVAERQVTVAYDEDQVDPAAVRARLAAIGYPAD